MLIIFQSHMKMGSRSMSCRNIYWTLIKPSVKLCGFTKMAQCQFTSLSMGMNSSKKDIGTKCLHYSHNFLSTLKLPGWPCLSLSVRQYAKSRDKKKGDKGKFVV